MSTKKILALAGLLLILATGLALAQDQTRAQEANKVATQTQTRTKFMDQNGDGINDLFRDHDNDGIPNCQDPDWTRPQDGTGYKNKYGQQNTQNKFGNRKGFHGGQAWSNQSFRNSQKGSGGGVCDGTGPKGKASRKGRT